MLYKEDNDLRIFKKILCGLCLILFSTSSSSCSTDKISVKLYDGNEFIRAVTVKVNEEYSFGTATKIGYSFKGWYTDSNGGSAYTDSNGNSAGLIWKKENKTDLFAHWEVKDYLIKFDYCGATSNNHINSMEITYGQEVTATFPVPGKSGYSFDGWFTDEINGNRITDNKGEVVDDAKFFKEPIYPINDISVTLFARWTSKTTTLTFVTDGSPVSSIVYQTGDTIHDLPISKKNNYCFVAWCFDESLIDELKLPYKISDNEDKNIILYAKFVYGSVDVLNFKSINNDKEYSVSYTGNSQKLVIPDLYFGKEITKIEKIEASSVVEILLPQTIINLDEATFENCYSLQKVNIPIKLKSIPKKCFFGCSSLLEINFSYYLETIGDLSFSDCFSIKEINIPENVNLIGAGAFKNMVNLEKIYVEPNNVNYISIDDVLYYKLANSTYLVQFPAAKEAKNYEIDESTVKLMEYSFSGSKIEKIVIGSRISSIENYVFEGCKNLINVTINTTSTNLVIGSYAFSNCTNLKALLIYTSSIPILNSSVFLNVSSTFSIYVSSSMISNYKTATNWRELSDCIFSLGDIYGDFAIEEAFDGYYIKQYFGTDDSVSIPEIINAKKIIGISSNAFSFSNMDEVFISKYISEIKDCAFANCLNLQKVILRCNPPALGIDVFENVGSDFAVYIDNTVEVLNMYLTNDDWNIYPIWSYNS